MNMSDINKKKTKMPEWKPIGALDKRRDFALGSQSEDRSPIDRLHSKIRELSDVQSIIDIGYSTETNEYLEKQLEKFANRKYPYLSKRHVDFSVGIAMLDSSPVTLKGDEFEDFQLYERTKRSKK